jgi:hypothetical protein
MTRAGLLGAGVALAATVLATAPASAEETMISVVGRDLSFAIARCYAPPQNVPPPYPAVGLLFNFKPNGQLDGPPQLIDPPGGGPKVQAVRSAVLTAAIRCARVQQASRFQQAYPEWKTLRIFFKPGPDR